MSFLRGTTAEEKMKDLVVFLLDNRVVDEDGSQAVFFTREEVQEIEDLQLEEDW